MVELLYFDGCPNYETLLPRLQALIEREGIADEVVVRRVESVDAAEQERFLGSPTVRIDGVDVDPGAAARSDFGLKCRLYRSDQGTSGAPPEQWIVEALHAAAGQSESAMSPENVEIVRNAFAAFDRGDIDGILRHCAEDIVIKQPTDLPGVSPEQHGHLGVTEALGIWPAQWDDFRVEILRIAAAPGSKVLVTARTRGRGKQSGIEVDMEFGFVFTLRDARISEWRMFLGEDQAREAAGLSE
jgi:ketosteroid isomerase-like protein